MFAHAYTALRQVFDGLFMNELILFAFDVSCFIDKKEVRFVDKVIVCTDKRLLLINNFKKAKIHLRVKDIEAVYMQQAPKLDLNKLIFKTKDGKEFSAVTNRPKTNSMFI